MEKWKIIKGFGDYMVSDKGRVYSFKTDRYLSPRNHSAGYSAVMLSKDGVTYEKLIHRLVAEAFIPIADSTLVVNHKDRNKKNNNVKNLEWLTFADNIRYTTDPRGLSHKYPVGKSGERYIHVVKSGFRVIIDRQGFKRGASFKSLAEAVAYRKEVLGA